VISLGSIFRSDELGVGMILGLRMRRERERLDSDGLIHLG